MPTWVTMRDRAGDRIMETLDQRFRLLEARTVEGRQHWVLVDRAMEQGQQLVTGGITDLPDANRAVDAHLAMIAAKEETPAPLTSEEGHDGGQAIAREPAERAATPGPAVDEDDLFLSMG